MSDFTVVEIIDARTVRVSPNWSFKRPGDQDSLIGNLVIISGLNASGDNLSAKQRLDFLLLNKAVDFFNPELISSEPATVCCNATIDQVDVSYYFPEYKQVGSELANA